MASNDVRTNERLAERLSPGTAARLAAAREAVDLGELLRSALA